MALTPLSDDPPPLEGPDPAGSGLLNPRDPGGAHAASGPDPDHTIVSDGAILSPAAAYTGLRPRDLGRALVGQRIENVHLEKFIGGGGMGAVFRGRDLDLQRTVAVKVLATHAASNPDSLRRFQLEAQSAARLDHPNIARVHFAGESNGLRYIVFEHIDGVNLRDLVATNGPLSVVDALRFTSQVTDALDHASKRSVVHRDVKPSNILITREGVAKLVDMGLARMYEGDAKEHELTSSGVTLGTFDYIAPEQARDPRDADIRSDIYSLGCTLVFMLTGRPPFPEGNALQKLLQHQSTPPPDVRGARPDLPREFAELLDRMLAKDPAARPQTPEELQAGLAAAAAPLGVALGPVTLPPPVNRRPWLPRHAPWAAPLAVVLGYAALLALAPGPAAAPFEPIEQELATEAADPADGPHSEGPFDAPFGEGLLENGLFDKRAFDDSPAEEGLDRGAAPDHTPPADERLLEERGGEPIPMGPDPPGPLTGDQG